MRPPYAISGHTRLAAVIGHPVRHSLSPTIHNAAFAAADLDWAYVALDVAPGDGGRAVEAMRALGIAGMSVTMPHKQAVAEAADARTTAVERLGSANCLFWDGDRIVADSTDGDGFVAAFTHRFGTGFDGLSVGVIGAGGAAGSIIEALGRHGADKIVVVNRSASRLDQAVALATQARAGETEELAQVDVIVNATPVGMAGGAAADHTPVPIDLVRPDQKIVDIVYNPARTPLMTAASERGVAVQGGVPMLVHQAALAFRNWTGQDAPLDAMVDAVADFLG